MQEELWLSSIRYHLKLCYTPIRVSPVRYLSYIVFINGNVSKIRDASQDICGSCLLFKN